MPVSDTRMDETTVDGTHPLVSPTLFSPPNFEVHAVYITVARHILTYILQNMESNYPKIKFITSGGLGSMGFALPASIGVKIGLSNEKVICICGDGGFTMSLIEILTSIENKINIKVFIINNSYQLMVKMWQEKFYNNQLMGVKMNNPPFEQVCKTMGCHGIKVDSINNLDEKIKYILDYEDGPIICNFITDENESVLPMVSPGKALDDMIIIEDDENNKEKYSGDAPC